MTLEATNPGNDSRAPGYLLPQTPPADDDELLDLLQPIIFHIGGWTDGSLVRPRWQTPDVPNQPPPEKDWCGFGVRNTREDTFITELHVDSGLGYDLVEYSEEVDVLISCYGPKSGSFARKLRDGFRVDQNRAGLQAMNADTLYCSNPVAVPYLLHGIWIRRVDITVTLRRYVSIKYNVRTLVEANGSIDTEQFVDPFEAGKAAP